MDKVRLQDRIKDTHLNKLITQAGMSKEYVELLHDYAPRSRGKEHTPYARFYRDKLSGRRVMVASMLPRVSHTGFSIVPRWRSVGRKFIAEENCFGAKIDNGTVTVTCVNDQPTGGKVNDQLIWHPQLYLDNVEQFSGNPVWLDTDPINSGYNFNTLEWDYGFCKRRVRIIEGRIRERWVFTANPNGEVRIKHNHAGALRLKMGEFKINGDEELVPVSAFDEAKYPFEVMASPETFYPDPHVEVSSVDGNAKHIDAAGITWAALRDGAGTTFGDSQAIRNVWQLVGHADTDRFISLARSIFVYDTSGLPNDATVTAGTFSIQGESKQDAGSWTPDINVYKSTPFSNTALQNDDYVDVGIVALSSVITYGNYSTAGYNDFALSDVDTDDFGYISLTSVTKLGCRNANYDVADSPPTWAAAVDFATAYFAEQGNTSQDPKLVVTYSVPAVPGGGSPMNTLLAQGIL